MFVNLTSINRTLNKVPVLEMFVNLTSINRTLNKVPVLEMFVNLTSINSTQELVLRSFVIDWFHCNDINSYNTYHTTGHVLQL